MQQRSTTSWRCTLLMSCSGSDFSPADQTVFTPSDVRLMKPASTLQKTPEIKSVVQLGVQTQNHNFLISLSHFHQGLPATSSHKLFTHRVTSVSCFGGSVPVLAAVFGGGAIRSCHVASLSCCCSWGVAVHLGKHTESCESDSANINVRVGSEQRRHRNESATPAVLPQTQTAGLTDCCQHFNELFTLISPSQLKCQSDPTQEAARLVTWGRQEGTCVCVCACAVCVTHAASSLPHLLDITGRSSCAGSDSGRCVGHTAPRSHTRRSLHSLARNDWLCSLQQDTNTNCLFESEITTSLSLTEQLSSQSSKSCFLHSWKTVNWDLRR